MRRPLSALKPVKLGIPIVGAFALTATLALPGATASAQTTELAKPAAQIFTDAVTAMRHVKDFHVQGNVHEGTELISLNLTMSTQGGGGAVTLKGATLEIVVTPKFSYLKADKQSWQILAGGSSEGAATAQLLANRWLKVPASNAQFASFAQLTYSTKFLKTITAQSVQFTKSGESTWDGRSAIVLNDSKGTKVYIAAASPHYLLGVAGSDATAAGSLKFTDFGSAPLPGVPTNTLTLPNF